MIASSNAVPSIVNFTFAIRLAKRQIEAEIGGVVTESGMYESEPWGFENDSWFLNQVLVCTSALEPSEVLTKIHAIEKELGRIRNNPSDGYQSRSIDIDILFYDNQIVNQPNLIIPHPELHKRMFTLLPLQEIMKDFVHPVLKQTISKLVKNCQDAGKVKK